MKKFTAKQVREELKTARASAQREARKYYRALAFRPLEFIGTVQGDRTESFIEPPTVPGSYPTKKQILEVIQIARSEGCDSLFLESGLDGADCVMDMLDGHIIYCVSEYSVEIPL